MGVKVNLYTFAYTYISFLQIGVHLKMRRQFMRKALSVPTLSACERECYESRDFICRSFNYR